MRADNYNFNNLRLESQRIQRRAQEEMMPVIEEHVAPTPVKEDKLDAAIEASAAEIQANLAKATIELNNKRTLSKYV